MAKEKQKIILHCDCNNYFASIESLLRPELRDIPIAVAGNPKQRHGIIVSKNELAKAAGVQTAETIAEAKRKCPSLICVEPHHELYSEYSRRINKIYNLYTDQVEPFSIDESSLDMSNTWDNFASSPKAFADLLRQHIKTEIGITISVGVSYNRIFAKLASDLKKPDATTIIMQKDMENIIWPLDITHLLYVGKVTAEKLRKLNINTIGEIAKTDPDFLQSFLGKQGKLLSTYARGLDQSEIQKFTELEEAKSIGNGSTFSQNLTNWQEINQNIRKLIEKVSSRLKKSNRVANVIQIQMKSYDFQVNSRQTTLDYPLQEADHIEVIARQLMEELWDEQTPIRLITVTASDLQNKDTVYKQVSLEDYKTPKRVDCIRQEIEKQSLEGLISDLNHSMGGHYLKLGLDE